MPSISFGPLDPNSSLPRDLRAPATTPGDAIHSVKTVKTNKSFDEISTPGDILYPADIQPLTVKTMAADRRLEKKPASVQERLNIRGLMDKMSHTVLEKKDLKENSKKAFSFLKTLSALPTVGVLVQGVNALKTASTRHLERDSSWGKIKSPNLTVKKLEAINSEISKIETKIKENQKEMSSKLKGIVDLKDKGLIKIEATGIGPIEEKMKKLSGQLIEKKKEKYSVEASNEDIGMLEGLHKTGVDLKAKGLHFLTTGVWDISNKAILTTGMGLQLLGLSVLSTLVGTIASLTTMSFSLSLMTNSARNIINAAGQNRKLNELTVEAKAYQKIAEAYNTTTNEGKKASAEALEKASLIRDFVANKRKETHRKIVANSLSIATNTAVVVSCSLSLFGPNPILTPISLSALGLSFALLGVETAYEGISTKMARKKETTALASEENIAKSNLGVDMRLAAMIKSGKAPEGVLAYLGIENPDTFVKEVHDKAEKLSTRQITLINDDQNFATIRNFMSTSGLLKFDRPMRVQGLFEAP